MRGLKVGWELTDSCFTEVLLYILRISAVLTNGIWHDEKGSWRSEFCVVTRKRRTRLGDTQVVEGDLAEAAVPQLHGSAVII